jgi:hypothetical protein
MPVDNNSRMNSLPSGGLARLNQGVDAVPASVMKQLSNQPKPDTPGSAFGNAFDKPNLLDTGNAFKK